MDSKSIVFDDDSMFLNQGLRGISSAVFQARNLLIGKNGAGKSRFLNALRDMRKEKPYDECTTVVLDFPSLSLSESPTEQEPDIALYDIFIGNETANLSDFLALASQNGESFLTDMLSIIHNLQAQNTRKMHEEIFSGINDILYKLIGCRIVEDQNNNLTIEKLSEAENIIRKDDYHKMLLQFSPGERLILYICFFLQYLQLARNEHLVVLIDEPELHLHPHVLLTIMEWLYCSEKIDGLWVASHSLFLVPMFNFSEITVFENSTVLPHNSKMYKKLYDDLVGLANIDLFEMLKSLDGWQYYEFIVECFHEPTAVSKASSKDEQFQKMVGALLSQTNGPVKVLDYGAGKFRIWECLQIANNEDKVDLGRLQYEAFEPYPDKSVINQIRTRYGKNVFPIYETTAQIPEQKYSAVVLMNVLHEIDILEWEKTIKTIHKALIPDGILLLLEVETLSLGEQPFGNTGYLVLGEDEVKALFRDHGEIISYHNMPNEKSNCWLIPDQLLGRVNSSSIKNCVTQLMQNSKNILSQEFKRKLKLPEASGDTLKERLSARKYAFQSQQYINAMFALERLQPQGKVVKAEDNRPIFPGLKNRSDIE